MNLTALAQANPMRIADGIAAIVNPRLAAMRQPIPDREPQITARLARFLDSARAGPSAAKDARTKAH